MKFYYATFSGHYPVGASLVVCAENKDQARKLAEIECKAIGLKFEEDDKLIELDQSSANCVIVTDGNY